MKQSLDSDRLKELEELIRTERFTVAQIAEKLNINKQIVYRHKKSLGITEPRGSNRKYLADFDYFKTFSHEQSWLLGFILADGCILDRKCDGNKNPKLLTIALCAKDVVVLENIKKLLKSDYPIYSFTEKNLSIKTRGKEQPPKDYERRTLTIFSEEMCSDLIKIGIGPRKTYSIEWLDTIPKEYVPSFIRGIFDGDGSIGIYGEDKYLMVSINGTENLLLGLRSYLLQQGIVSNVHRANNQLYCLQTTRIHAKHFCDLIYKDKTDYSYLPRKFEIYQRSFDEIDWEKYRYYNVSSKFFGVCHTKRGYWISWVGIKGGGKKEIGYFKDEISAARAYNDYVIKNKLEKPLNIIDT
jgi:hypothetical protein